MAEPASVRAFTGAVSPRRRHNGPPWPPRLVLAAGLVADAVVHTRLGISSGGVTGALDQPALFLLEAAASAVAALLVLLRPRRGTVLFALLVAASALAAVLLYRYVDIGSLGAIPDMYEPFWYPGKVTAEAAEAVATAAAVLLLARPRYRTEYGTSRWTSPTSCQR